jgi:AcrR family transcriptional regulator
MYQVVQAPMTNESSKVEQRKNEVLEPICDFLLDRGIDSANLRALAGAAGTSNRMLLYYFADKDDLLTQALHRLGQRLAERLASRTPSQPARSDELIDRLWTSVQEPAVWPYMILFLEIIARGWRVGEPFSSASRAITNAFIDWVSSRLLVEPGADRHVAAREVLAVLDGRALIRIATSS